MEAVINPMLRLGVCNKAKLNILQQMRSDIVEEEAQPIFFDVFRGIYPQKRELAKVGAPRQFDVLGEDFWGYC